MSLSEILLRVSAIHKQHWVQWNHSEEHLSVRLVSEDLWQAHQHDWDEHPDPESTYEWVSETQ